MSPYFYVMTTQEQGKFIPLQIQRKQPINIVYMWIEGANAIQLKVVLLAWPI
jgi:hypothetical protein